MIRVLGFWTLAIALMAFAGDLYEMSVLFFIETAVFFLVGYMNLTERTNMMLFWAYMILSFLGITYYSVFVMDMPL